MKLREQFISNDADGNPVFSLDEDGGCTFYKAGTYLVQTVRECEPWELNSYRRPKEHNIKTERWAAWAGMRMEIVRSSFVKSDKRAWVSFVDLDNPAQPVAPKER